MRTITVRNVPDDVYRALQELAQANHRSLQGQALVMLERARVLRRSDPLAEARALREALVGRSFGGAVQDVRSERDR